MAINNNNFTEYFLDIKLISQPSQESNYILYHYSYCDTCHICRAISDSMLPVEFANCQLSLSLSIEKVMSMSVLSAFTVQVKLQRVRESQWVALGTIGI